MKVVLQKCSQYNLNELKEKIKYSLQEIGAFQKMTANSSIFLKVNCVGPFSPDFGITTHPIFVKALVQVLKETLGKTIKLTIGDNPATRDFRYVLKKCGFEEMIQEENIRVFEGKDFVKITNSNPKIYSSFEVSQEMINHDVFINLPKLKTHTLAYITCAEKNLFGLIYGLNKSAWHVKASTPLAFGEAMNDLYGAFLEATQDKTVIHLCDGILGLEGDGPSSAGSAIWSGALLCSLDAVALDYIACRVMDLDMHKFFINEIARNRHYGTYNPNEIELCGEKIESFQNVHFKPPKNSLSIFGLKLLKIKWMKNILLEHPKINKKICIRCGECSKICPPKAMTIKKGNYPHLKNTSCIRCWCCGEVCPQNAIQKSHRPFIGKILIKQDKNKKS